MIQKDSSLLCKTLAIIIMIFQSKVIVLDNTPIK